VNTHARVVREVLNHFFNRIPDPLASDIERRRIALKAIDQLAPTPSTFDLEGATIAQVQAAVEGNLVSVAAALAHENENAKRKSLTAWLEDRV
jgi:hypothetical protein